MANKARGEVTLELGGEKYVLVPSFGVIAEIEDELDTNMFKLGARIDQLDFNAKDLVRLVQAILKANGHEVAEDSLIEAIAKEGAGPVLAPMIAFIGGYLWGGQTEKKDAKAKKPKKVKQTPKNKAASSANS